MNNTDDTTEGATSASAQHYESVVNTLPSQADLERLQLHLANEKLKAETLKLRRDAEPEKWWTGVAKKIVAIGAFATVVATIYGIGDSYQKTLADRRRTSDADQRVRFEDAITRLEHPTTISKLVGVSLLSGYLLDADARRRQQTLFALAAFVATEQDQQTQTAVRDVIGALSTEKRLDGSDWGYFQRLLVTHSQAIIEKGNLARRRYLGSSADTRPEESIARNLGNLIAANVRNGVVPTYTDYRKMYCAVCDFRDVDFPTKANFEGAILDAATFARARLVGANFDNAYLGGVMFVEADLKGATFRTVDDSTHEYRIGSSPATMYVRAAAEMLETRATVRIEMPNFSCADLEDATFDGHSLFAVPVTAEREYAPLERSKPPWYASVPPYLIGGDAEKFTPVTVQQASFFRSNLKNAHFDKIQFFAFFGTNARSFAGLGNSTRIRIAELWFGWGELSLDAWAYNLNLQPRIAEFRRSIQIAFDEAELSTAKLPDSLLAALSGDVGAPTKPNCKPRHHGS